MMFFIFAVGGLLLIGSGISIIGEAIIRKAHNKSWFWWGTLGLIVFNTGLALFVEAGIMG